MFPKRERVISILDGCIKEMELLLEMSKDLQCADDFLSNMSGMILFRACGMSLQYITESLVKIRNLCGRSFFDSYRSIPWDSVFGMFTSPNTSKLLLGNKHVHYFIIFL